MGGNDKGFTNIIFEKPVVIKHFVSYSKIRIKILNSYMISKGETSQVWQPFSVDSLKKCYL